MPRRPFPPRPRHPTRFEPSVTSAVRFAVAVFGARRVMTPKLRRRLELTGLSWSEIAPVLESVRTIDDWADSFAHAADTHEAAGDFRRASAFALLGHLILSPFNPQKAVLQVQMCRCHVLWRTTRIGSRFESLRLCEGAIAAYRETPMDSANNLPAVLLLPPLASTKEELTLLADPLLGAGFTVLRMDLPGQGESPPPLTLDTERLLLQALDEAGVTMAGGGVIAGGISLGAYFALRLATASPERVRGVFGVSPPAIITPAQWARQPEIIYQYLDRYFATSTRAETLRLGLAMTLDNAAAISCPVLLYHAARDQFSLPDARDRYRTALSHTSLTDYLLPGGHGCLLHLRDHIAPEVAAWAKKLTDKQ